MPRVQDVWRCASASACASLCSHFPAKQIPTQPTLLDSSIPGLLFEFQLTLGNRDLHSCAPSTSHPQVHRAVSAEKTLEHRIFSPFVLYPGFYIKYVSSIFFGDKQTFNLSLRNEHGSRKFICSSSSLFGIFAFWRNSGWLDGRGWEVVRQKLRQNEEITLTRLQSTPPVPPHPTTPFLPIPASNSVHFHTKKLPQGTNLK